MNRESTFQWYITESSKYLRLPLWQRTTAVAPDGTVYVPAVLAECEFFVWLGASWAGIPVFYHKKHLFVPTWWIAREYPALRALCQKIEARVKEAEERESAR